MNECRCGRPTDAYVCETCGDRLARALGDVTWLDDQLDTTITRQRGIDYRRSGGGKGARAERPEPSNRGASDARTALHALLVSWVRLCDEDHVRNSDYRTGLPADTLPALSAWLLWRVDGLTLHEAGGEAVDEITDAVARCHRMVDRPPERQYLGECSECSGDLYAQRGGKVASCEACGLAYDAEEIRAGVLARLEDQLHTAAEIARLSTYLGLRANREAVRKRINTWSVRGLVERHGSGVGESRFRFGEVYPKLVQDEYGVRSA